MADTWRSPGERGRTVPLRDARCRFPSRNRSSLTGHPKTGAPFHRRIERVLIVARRKGQRIKIGENIEVVVTEISRGEVRLGIVAPKQVAVVREEMQRAVADANRAAAASALVDETENREVSVVTELGVGAFSSSSRAGTRS
jgi:carbon storage regulator